MTPPLEDVLNDFAAALEDSGGGYALLRDWTARYPEYAQQLAEFAADETLERYAAATPAAVDDERLLQVALDAAQGVLERARAERPPVVVAQAALPGLMARAREVGLNIRELADRSQLSVTLVGLLDRRLVRFASIPREVVDALATALQTQAASVAQYLQQGPSFAPSASFRAEAAPELPPQQDFAEAVRQDPTLDENRRASLLRLSPPTAG
ncbi:MAG TPA: hypothetical protein VGK33_08480 [Chloroflexota bacterium]|jgi:hypothetical protein